MFSIEMDEWLMAIGEQKAVGLELLQQEWHVCFDFKLIFGVVGVVLCVQISLCHNSIRYDCHFWYWNCFNRPRSCGRFCTNRKNAPAASDDIANTLNLLSRHAPNSSGFRVVIERIKEWRVQTISIQREQILKKSS